MNIDVYERRLCRLCVRDNINLYRSIKWTDETDFMPSIHCDVCTGVNSYVCRTCLKYIYSLPRSYRFLIDCDTIEIEKLTDTLNYIIYLDLTLCWCQLEGVYKFHKLIPYCTNIFHQVVNTFSFQDAVREMVVAEGYLLTVDGISSYDYCWQCPGPMDYEYEFYMSRYFSHLPYGEKISGISPKRYFDVDVFKWEMTKSGKKDKYFFFLEDIHYGILYTNNDDYSS